MQIKTPAPSPWGLNGGRSGVPVPQISGFLPRGTPAPTTTPAPTPAPPYNPATFPGLCFWMDPKDDDVIVGDPDVAITALLDKGPDGVLIEQDGADLIRVDDFLQSDGAILYVNGIEFLDHMHVFMLLNLKAAGVNMAASSTQGALVPYLYVYASGVGYDLLLRSNGGYCENSPRYAAITGKQLVEWHFNNHTGLKMLVNGVEVTLTSDLTGSTDLNRYDALGVHSNAPASINTTMEMGEVIMGNGIATDAEILACRTYLLAQIGL